MHFRLHKYYGARELRNHPAKNAAARAQRDARTNETKLDDLEWRVDRLSLACQAMWEYMRENFGVADNDIYEKMLEIDLRDGAEDGRMTARTVECGSCGQSGRSNNIRCLYCGEYLPRTHIME